MDLWIEAVEGMHNMVHRIYGILVLLDSWAMVASLYAGRR